MEDVGSGEEGRDAWDLRWLSDFRPLGHGRIDCQVFTLQQMARVEGLRPRLEGGRQ